MVKAVHCCSPNISKIETETKDDWKLEFEQWDILTRGAEQRRRMYRQNNIFIDRVVPSSLDAFQRVSRLRLLDLQRKTSVACPFESPTKGLNPCTNAL